MHIEIQVALNFVISYLYNKLPRRRVNIFGEELEKALRDKFQGHWYPETPFKGSAFRCLKTGDPIDAVLVRAARESGVPITDILENLPHELSVWVDPGEVSYRIGEKSMIKILFSENNDNHDDNNSADREVNKTFNPEAQCFRPIDAINNSLNNLSLSPKISPPSASSPHSVSSTSPTYKSSPNPIITTVTNGTGPFIQRNQAPLTFTTATFAQTKFGSTKLKTNSKRANSSYRMSPTEFSNYIKQRAIQQQLHPHGSASTQSNHFGPIGSVSPARSLSPNPLSLGLGQSQADPYYISNMSSMGFYPNFNGQRNIFDTHFQPDNNSLYGQHSTLGINGTVNGIPNKFSPYLEPHTFYGIPNLNYQQQAHHQITSSAQQPALPNEPLIALATPSCASPPLIATSITSPTNLQQSIPNCNNVNIDGTNYENECDENDLTASQQEFAINTAVITINLPTGNSNIANDMCHAIKVAKAAEIASSTEDLSQTISLAPVAVLATSTAATSNNQDSSNNAKLRDNLNSFYSSSTGSYQQLLVAN